MTKNGAGEYGEHLQEKGTLGVLEKFSEHLEFAESKKNSLRKSICSLTREWTEFEKSIELTQRRSQECFSELESREKNLNADEESVRQRSEEWKLLGQRIQEKLREIQKDEKALVLLQEERMAELALKEKNWEMSREKMSDEFREREARLNEREGALNNLSETLQSEKNVIAAWDKCIEERLKDVELKEERLKELEFIQEGLEKSVKELDERERKITEREKMVSFSCFNSLREEWERGIKMKEKAVGLIMEDLELKKKELDFFITLNEKRAKELEMRERQLEVKSEDFQLKMMKYLEEKKLLEGGNKELEVKNKLFGDRVIAFEVREKDFKLEEKKYLDRKDFLERRNEELELKRNEFEEKVKIFGIREKEFEWKEKKWLEEKKLSERRNQELELNKKELEERIKAFETREEEFQSKEKIFLEEKETLEKGNKELEFKKKELEERIKAFDVREKEFKSKERKFDDELQFREPVRKSVEESSNNNSCPTSTTVTVELDGQEMYVYLNDLRIDRSSEDEVLEALQSSVDPVAVVLNAVEVIYPPYLVKEDVRFEGTVARSCVLLLEQLVKISPNIQSGQREHALKLALEWKDVISIGNSQEVLSFLFLLASFDLGSAFDKGVTVMLVENAAEHPQMPKLCRLLGLRDTIPGFIMDLINKQQYILALGYVCELNLVDKFNPLGLLKKHIRSKRLAPEMCKDGQPTPEARDLAICVEISALQDAIKCISDHGLQYKPDKFRERIAQLETQRANLKGSTPAKILDQNREPCTSGKALLGQEGTRKRPASDITNTTRARLPIRKKVCRKFSYGQSSYAQPSSHSPGGLHTERHVTVVPKNNTPGGRNPTMQRAYR